MNPNSQSKIADSQQVVAPPATENRLARLITAAMETLLLLLIAVSPWPFGMVQPRFEFWLCMGVAALVGLWAAKILLTWRFSVARCPIVTCLAAIFLFGMLQIAPLPASVLELVSPGTSELYAELLPQDRERVQGGDVASALQRAGSTISVYPEATRRWLLRFLVILLLFLVVRNNLCWVASGKRLSCVALVSGVALSIFGMVQFFTSADNSTLFWSVPSQGEVFGPFVNRNHFAMYNNLCLGLGLAWLLSRRSRVSDPRGSQGRHGLGWSPGSLFQDATSWWIAAGLVLMLVASLLSLSRGGFLAAVGAATACGAVTLYRRRGQWGVGLAATSLVLLLAALLVGFLGWTPVTTRLASIWSIEAQEAGRLTLWSRAMPQLRQFPLFGSGRGTFPFVEPMFVHGVGDARTAYVHAHNEYLEFWMEGGLFQLALLIGALGFTVRACCRMCCSESPTVAGLGLGFLFGVTSFGLHSFVEFGVHIPAIALLATVLAAHASGGAAAPAPRQAAAVLTDRQRRRRRYRSVAAAREPSSARGLAPALAILSAGMFCLVLYHENGRVLAVADARRAVRGLQAIGDLASCQRREELLSDALRLAPADAEIHFELAQAHLDIYQLKAVPGAASDRRQQLLAADHVLPAMSHLLHARDLCPVLPLPHLRIAANLENFAAAEPVEQYLQRVKRLCPVDATLWFLCGQEELNAGSAAVWQSWKKSLSLSDRHLAAILNQSARQLTAAQILEHVLPDRPAVVVAAADHFYAQEDPAARTSRRPFLERALELFDTRVTERTAAQLLIKARAHRELGQTEEAVAAFRRAARAGQISLPARLEFVRFLHTSGRDAQARRELRLLLLQPESRPSAQRLLDSINSTAQTAGD